MANAKISDLFNEFEAERNAASINAAIDKEIEDIECDIFFYVAALNLLDVSNIEDIKFVDNKKFVIIFKNDNELHHLLGIETPEGVEIYGTENGVRIAITDKSTERLDEHFCAFIAAVKEVIAGLEQQIDELVGKKKLIKIKTRVIPGSLFFYINRSFSGTVSPISFKKFLATCLDFL